MDFNQQAELAYHPLRVSGCKICDLAVENALQKITRMLLSSRAVCPKCRYWNVGIHKF
jgi:hypothetical protein